MSECESLGCVGDNQCHRCAMGGAVARMPPQIKPLVDAAMPFADMFGIPEPYQAAAKTAVGIGTPVSEEDLTDFTALVAAWSRIQAESHSAPPPIRGRIGAAKASYQDFVTLWNAAQRDPAALRRQLNVAESLLSAIESSRGGGRDLSQIRLPRIPRRWPKALVLTGVGLAAAAVGGAVALVAGRK
jgi:hypothetical protein